MSISSFEPGLPKLTWEAREVVREVDHQPHLLVRVTVAGGHFPHRALVPFLRIVAGEQIIPAWFTETSGDSTQLQGYFAIDLPAGGLIEYGYDTQVFGRVRAKFAERRVERLDRKRLAGEIVETTRELLARKLR